MPKRQRWEAVTVRALNQPYSALLELCDRGQGVGAARPVLAREAKALQSLTQGGMRRSADRLRRKRQQGPFHRDYEHVIRVLLAAYEAGAGEGIGATSSARMSRRHMAALCHECG